MWKAFLVVFSFSPWVVLAAGLVPCGGAGEPQCQLCHLAQLITGVFEWLVAVSGVVVVILIILNGVKLASSAGNASTMQSTKRFIANALIGYAILIGSWTIIDTVLRAMVGGQAYGFWNEIQCVAQPELQRAGRTTASGDNRTTLPPAEVANRVEGIQSSGSVQTDITNAAVAAGLTEDQTDIFRALISQESSNCANRTGPATSYGTAYGCGQLLVGTARELDPSLRGLSDEQVAARLRDDNAYNLTLSARNLDRLLDRYNGDVDSALAHYNGGYAATQPSTDCPGRRRWECTWDSPGCYNTGRTDCVRNTGYQETRNYVTNIKAVAAGL